MQKLDICAKSNSMGQKVSVAQEEENELFNIFQLRQRHTERQLAKTSVPAMIRTIPSASPMKPLPTKGEHR